MIKYSLEILLGDSSIGKKMLLVTREFSVVCKIDFFTEEPGPVLLNVRDCSSCEIILWCSDYLLASFSKHFCNVIECLI
jgi:hypothetical protein